LQHNLEPALGEYDRKIPELIVATVGATNQNHREILAISGIIAIGEQLDSVRHRDRDVVMLDDLV